SADNQGDHRLELQSTRTDTAQVRVKTIDSLLRNVPLIDVVKVDTQGSETHVVQGMAETLNRNSNTRMVLEFWPFGLHNCGSSVEELVDVLENKARIFWLLRWDGVAEEVSAAEVSAANLLELAKEAYAPHTQHYADIVVLNKADSAGISSM